MSGFPPPRPSIMGAILLAALGATPERGTGVELLVATAKAAGIDVAVAFRFVFVAVDAFLVCSCFRLDNFYPFCRRCIGVHKARMT